MKNNLLYFLVFVSIFSTIPVAVLAFFPPEPPNDFQYRKQFTGVLFISVCISGMISVFFPKQCSAVFHKSRKTTPHAASVSEKENFERSSTILGLVLTHGHHPECDGFHHHEFRVRRKTFCVACMGLFFGAVLAILGGTLHFLLRLSIEIDASVLVAIGIFGVVSCLLQYSLLELNFMSIRFLTNALFIFGMFLILVSIDLKVKSLAQNLFMIGMFVFWLFTRILLSKNNHTKICQVCENEHCIEKSS